MSIPNTLTIFINTNIRGSSKIIYKPYMTVPVEDEEKKKKEDVNFNPLIRLNKKIINDIPYDVNPKEIYTQFFKKNEFESLISRTISKTFQFRNTNLYTATKYGYIDNNIRLTLDTIFRHNAPFFIKDKPYLVDSYSWTMGDWRIDTKKLENKFMNFAMPLYSMSNYYVNGINQEIAERELEMIPPQLRGGIMSQNQLSRFEQEFMGLKPFDLQQQINQQNLGPNKAVLVKPSTDNKQTVYNNPVLRSALPAVFQNTFRKVVVEPAVSLNEGQMNLHNQPLTLNMVFGEDRDFSGLRSKHSILNKKYEDMINSVNEYIKLCEDYDNKMGFIQKSGININDYILTSKKMSHELIKNYYEYLQKNKNIPINTLFADKDVKEKLYEITNSIINTNKKISKELIDSIEILNKTFLKENDVYKKYLDFYTELKYVYVKQMKKKKLDNIIDIPLLLIDYDINNYKNLIENTEYNNFLKNFKHLVSYFKKTLEPIINKNYNIYNEIARYIEAPELLYIEKNFLTVYSFTLHSNKLYQDCITWKTLNSYYNAFYENFLKTTKKQIENLNVDYMVYKQNYNDIERESIEKSIETERNEGASVNNSILDMIRTDNKIDTGIKAYKRLEIKILLCYDLIYLYTMLTLTKISKNSVYEKSIHNVNNVNKGFYIGLQDYYIYFKDVFLKIKIVLENYPYSVIAKNSMDPIDKKNLDDAISNCVEETKNLTQIIEDFDVRNSDILLKEYEEMEKKIFPEIDRLNIKNQCLSLFGIDKDEFGNPIDLPNAVGNLPTNLVVPTSVLTNKDLINYNDNLEIFLPPRVVSNLKYNMPTSTTISTAQPFNQSNLTFNPMLNQPVSNNISSPPLSPIIKSPVKPPVKITNVPINNQPITPVQPNVTVAPETIVNQFSQQPGSKLNIKLPTKKSNVKPLAPVSQTQINPVVPISQSQAKNDESVTNTAINAPPTVQSKVKPEVKPKANVSVVTSKPEVKQDTNVPVVTNKQSLKVLPELTEDYIKNIIKPIIKSQTKTTKKHSKDIQEMFYYLSLTGGDLNIIKENSYDEDEYISQYTVLENEGGGDCFFAVIRDALNGNNVYNNDINNVKMNSSRESIYAGTDGLFTVQGIRNAVADNFTNDMYEFYKYMTEVAITDSDTEMISKFRFMINDNGSIKTIEEVKDQIRRSCVASNNPQGGPSGNYWGDEYTIKIIEEVFKIKLVIFDASPASFKQNYFISYKSGKKHLKDKSEIAIIDKTQNYYDKKDIVKFPSVITNLDTLEEVLIDKNYNYKENPYEIKINNDFFPVLCGQGTEDTSKINNYVFILLTGESNSQHYQLIVNTNTNEGKKVRFSEKKKSKIDFIYDEDNMYPFVLYWIYLTCYKNIKNSVFSKLPVIGEKLKNIDTIFKSTKYGGTNNVDDNDVVFEINENILQNGGQTQENDKNITPTPYQIKNPRIRNYGTRYVDSNSPNTKEQSKLSYYVIIDLNIIEKGKWNKIPIDAQIKLKCNSTKEKIRKAYSDMFGLRYEPLERRITSFFDSNEESEEKDKESDKKDKESDNKDTQPKKENKKGGSTVKNRKHSLKNRTMKRLK